MNHQRTDKSINRDDYFRCPVCSILYSDIECTLDPIKGFVCPRQCSKPFIQPEYESPLNSS